MNQKEFMELLDYYFRNIDSYIYKEIRKDYVEHFRIGKENGKQEEVISRELGSPKEIYEEYRESGIFKENQQENGILFDLGNYISNLFKGKKDFGYKYYYGKEDKSKEYKEEKNDGYHSPGEFVQHTETFQKDINRLEVRVSSTNVEVRNHDKETVEVTYLVDKGDEELPIRMEGSILTIGKLDFGRTIVTGKRSNSKEIIIKIPVESDMGINIWVDSGDVDIDVENCDVSVQSAAGDVNIINCGNYFGCNSAAGNIKVQGCKRHVNLKSAAGNIHIDGKFLRIDANSMSGNIEFNLEENQDISINTVSGNVRGQIENKNYHLSASTISGDISVDGHTIQRSKVIGKSMREISGNGRYSASIKTVSGDIDIR